MAIRVTFGPGDNTLVSHAGDRVLPAGKLHGVCLTVSDTGGSGLFAFGNLPEVSGCTKPSAALAIIQGTNVYYILGSRPVLREAFALTPSDDSEVHKDYVDTVSIIGGYHPLYGLPIEGNTALRLDTSDEMVAGALVIADFWIEITGEIPNAAL